MIWLTWRQLRSSATVVVAALGLLAAVLAATGGHLDHLSDTAGDTFLDQLAASRSNRTLYLLGIAVMHLLPAVVGAFWGAPLVARELESGTHRLVWNQGVTRTRWLAVKLGVTGLVAATAAGLLGLALTWWCAPIDTALDHGSVSGLFHTPRLSAVMFGARGLVPTGYTVLAFALGVTVGLLVRRTLPAMAVTMAAVAAIQVAVPLAVAPRLVPSTQQDVPVTAETFRGLRAAGPNGPVLALEVRLHAPGAWIRSSRTVDGAGRQAGQAVLANCLLPEPGAGMSEADEQAVLTHCFAQLDRLGFHQRITYLPASRYWPLQWYGTAVLLGLAAALVAVDIWLIRRRLS